MSKVIEIFDSFKSIAQTKTSLGLLQKELVQALQSSRISSFRENFFDIIDHILLVFKKDPRVDILLKLIASFVASAASPTESTISNSNTNLNDISAEKLKQQQTSFSESTLNHLIQRTTAANKAVRYRAVQLVGEIFERVTEDSEFSIQLLDHIQATLVSRAYDKIAIIRQSVAFSLRRLQQVEKGKDCPVIQTYLNLLLDPAVFVYFHVFILHFIF
jgi:hypothetical protein